MIDDQGAQIEENETLESMPDSEQTTEPNEPDEAGESESSTQDDGVGELPEGTRARTTEQFEKLKAQLAEEREKRARLERQYGFQAPVDPNNPVAALQSELVRLKTQVDGFTKKSEEQQELEAYQAFPELNPKSGQFDPDFQEQVISHMATQFARGEQPTIKQAAEKLVAIAERRAKKAEKIGAQKALEQLSPKEQASLEATGRSDRRLPSTDVDALREGTRRGDSNAVYERLMRLNSVTK